MLAITLYGVSTCRRTQKMRQRVLDEATRLNLPIHLDEVSETAQLAQFSPISLPRLYINGQLAASQNPPSVEQIAALLRKENAS